MSGFKPLKAALHQVGDPPDRMCLKTNTIYSLLKTGKPRNPHPLGWQRPMLGPKVSL